MSAQARSTNGSVPGSTDRAEQARAGILAQAALLAADRGFHAMSMRDLARACGCGLSSLYTYFPSKDALLYDLQARAFESLHATAESAVAGVPDPAERLLVFIDRHVRFIAAHPEVMRVLVREAAALGPLQRQGVRGRKERYFELGRELVRDVLGGCGHHVGAPCPDDRDEAEVERLTYSVFGMLNWVWGWYDAARHGEPEQVARSIHSLAMNGLVVRCPLRQGQAGDHDAAPGA